MSFIDLINLVIMRSKNNVELFEFEFNFEGSSKISLGKRTGENFRNGRYPISVHKGVGV